MNIKENSSETQAANIICRLQGCGSLACVVCKRCQQHLRASLQWVLMLEVAELTTVFVIASSVRQN